MQIQDTGLQPGDEGAYKDGCGELPEWHPAVQGCFLRIRGGKHTDIKECPSLLPKPHCLGFLAVMLSHCPISCHFPGSFTFIFTSRYHFPASGSPTVPHLLAKAAGGTCCSPSLPAPGEKCIDAYEQQTAHSIIHCHCSSLACPWGRGTSPITSLESSWHWMDTADLPPRWLRDVTYLGVLSTQSDVLVPPPQLLAEHPAPRSQSPLDDGPVVRLENLGRQK